MKPRMIFALLAATCLMSARTAPAAEQPAVPAIAKPIPVHEGKLEIEAAQEWSRRVTLPEIAPDERPVLALRAYADAGGGCNFVMEALINSAPLTESPLRRRLLNKLPFFDPPGTEYHFTWYDPRAARWMTMFGEKEPITWGGTGRDTEFIFDLTGLVSGGEAVKIGFKHAIPSLPAAIKRDRAPLVLNDIQFGVLKAEDVARLRAAVEDTSAMKQATVRPDLPADAAPGPRPYEVEWSGRQESPRAQVAFEDLKGWTVLVSGDMAVSLSASVAQRLWRRQVGDLCATNGTGPTTILLRPPKPVRIEGQFDAADLWLYADFDRMKDMHPQVVAYLEDSAGRDFALDLGRVNNSFWVLQHGVLERHCFVQAKWPMQFIGLSLSLRPPRDEKDKRPRHFYLESLAFYQRNRKPFVENTRPQPPPFPISDKGMLPTPPAEAKVRAEAAGQGAVLTCESPQGALRFRVEPEKGMFDGVSAQWQEGPSLRPMAGGDMRIDLATDDVTAKPQIVSSKLDGDKLIVRWKRGVEWQAAYSLSGRTLVVDVECKGGAAEGLGYGQVEGLPAGRAIEVPYLTYGMGYGPAVACGGGLFVSVLADWYHCDCSLINSSVPKSRDGCVGLMTGTEYMPLTDGRRNDMRERVLVTVSPEFADILPNIPHPASPDMKRLSPYMFMMTGSMQPTFLTTLKRYGIDDVISCDFAKFYVQNLAAGFAGRWRPHPSLTMKQIQDYRKHTKDLGYLFAAYSDIRDWFPLNEFWDANCVSLDPKGDLVDGWYGNHRTKPNYMPVLARLVGEKVREHYPPDSVYMDTHSCVGAIACDFEAGVPGAGIARDQVFFNGDCILETKKWYASTMSEGRVRWMYAGIVDMDYASVFLGRPADEVQPFPDFDLLKIHPLNLGTMMGYGPSIFFSRESEKLRKMYGDPGTYPAPIEFHQYVCASLGYGHMLMTGYSYFPPLGRMIQLYAMMQGAQKEYLTDTVAEICYHDGKDFVSTSRALLDDTQKLGRVRVRYAKGLTVHINYNAEQSWTVGGYDLPPYGWLIEKPNEILVFSALIAGRRVDYARCPDYVYLNTGDKPGRVEAVELQGAVWIKREGGGLRVIPCGYLGTWEIIPAPGLPEFQKDRRVKGLPADRGCGPISIDTQSLMGKAPAALQIEARNEKGEKVEAKTESADRLTITPGAEAVDYIIR
ncbi:MAG: hypothetical protein AB1696_22160 [Planctomycetota bacterium]